MKFGFVFPEGDARRAADFACEAERAGWDGFFVWEPVWGMDAWVMLAACAMVTERIRLGTLLTPMSRQRPWKLAGETVTVDHLSNGRVILSVGLGAPHENSGWDEFGEITDRKTRAERLDEGLEILTGLWRGQPFSFQGKHYTVKPRASDKPGPPLPPPPVQQPRIPIWVVGAINREKSLRRVCKYDGLLPQLVFDRNGATPDEARGFTPAQLRAAVDWILAQRKLDTEFDVIVEENLSGNLRRDLAAVNKWRAGGATWLIHAMWDTIDDPSGAEQVLARIRRGPPPV